MKPMLQLAVIAGVIIAIMLFVFASAFSNSREGLFVAVAVLLAVAAMIGGSYYLRSIGYPRLALLPLTPIFAVLVFVAGALFKITIYEQYKNQNATSDQLGSLNDENRAQKLREYLINKPHVDYRNVDATTDLLLRHVQAMGAEELKREKILETLLLNMKFPVSTSIGTPLPPDKIIPIANEVRSKVGNVPGINNFPLKQRNQVIVRIGEIGFDKWREEVKAEHPIYAEISFAIIPDTFKKTLVEAGVKAPGPVSKTVGSLPMHILSTYTGNFAADARTNEDTIEALKILKDQGIDFTPEELADPSLQEYLKSIGL